MNSWEEEEDGEVVIGPLEPQYVGSDDTGVYSQTLSNTVLALIQWNPVDAEERLFLRMQLKRLVDAQVALLALYVEEEKK